MEQQIIFLCNDKKISVNFSSSAVLLDLLRKKNRLTGTKEGCREGDCGACTVILGELNNGKIKYKSVNSCLLPAGAVIGRHVITIEGLNTSSLNTIQKSFAEEGAVQCGFCTPGFIVSLTSYFLSHDNYNSKDAINYLGGNLCRCTGHSSIIRAVEKLIDTLSNFSIDEKIPFLISQGIIPEYFINSYELLVEINNSIHQDVKINQHHFVVAGGTDIYVQKQESIYESDINLLEHLSNNENIYENENRCIINALTTINEIKDSVLMNKLIPDIKKYLLLFGSEQIRNRATVAGNIINASPIGDLTNILLALNSTIHLRYEDEERKVLLKDFYLGYKKLDLRQNEIVTHISFPIYSGNFLFNFEKVSKREHLDIASVNTSMFIESEDDKIISVHLSAGGVAPIPLYLQQTVNYLSGKEINISNILEAVEEANKEISPISDARGSKEYKRLLLRQLIFAHFIKLFPQYINAKSLL